MCDGLVGVGLQSQLGAASARVSAALMRFLWVVPAWILPAVLGCTLRAIASWCSSRDQSGLSFVTKQIHKILLLLKDLVLWKLVWGSRHVGRNRTFFWVVDHCLVLTHCCSPEGAPACPAWSLSKRCLPSSQHRRHPSVGLVPWEERGLVSCPYPLAHRKQ